MKEINRVLDRYLENDADTVKEKRKAARRIKTWLLGIDQQAEEVSTRNLDMLSRLMESLKGDKLCPTEWDLLIEMVYHEKLEEEI